jgi:dCMP deaminase
LREVFYLEAFGNPLAYPPAKAAVQGTKKFAETQATRWRSGIIAAFFITWSCRMRPDWDSYFMKIAYAVSERSTCDRAFVGCVLVLEKRILTTGFNGSPTGQPHCDEEGHLMVDGHCIRTIHAETNAIIQAALHGVSTKGATCYVTHLPCINCTKALINAGIVRLVYSIAYRTDENAMNFLKAANIEISQNEFDVNTSAATD